jgi:NAD(P)-dependent dehydrogenase (short-subunit alcohol dehydrogenase family)
MNRFNEKVAVISGGADGLGKAIAHRIASEGGQVALFDRNADLLQKAVEEFTRNGLKASGHVVDVAIEEQVIGGYQEVIQNLGNVHIMVNAAGIVGPSSTPITSYPTAAFDDIYAVNLRGTFLMAKYALEIMEPANYGRMLLIASIAGKEGNPGMVGYSATKAGVIGIVKGIGKEFAHKNITINGLAPAVIKTAMNADTHPDQLAYMTAKIPMGRLGTVEEVAAMASWIVSEECTFSTGFTFDLSGGRATY